MSRKTQLRFSIEDQDCQEKRSCMDTKRGKNIKGGAHLEKKKQQEDIWAGERVSIYTWVLHVFRVLQFSCVVSWWKFGRWEGTDCCAGPPHRTWNTARARNIIGLVSDGERAKEGPTCSSRRIW